MELLLQVFPIKFKPEKSTGSLKVTKVSFILWTSRKQSAGDEGSEERLNCKTFVPRQIVSRYRAGGLHVFASSSM